MRSPSLPAPLLHLLFAVAGAALLAFLVAPLLALLAGAPGATVRAAVEDGELRAAILVSLAAGAGAVLLGLLLGTPLGYLIERGMLPGRDLVQALLALPLVIPHPVAGIALLLVFSKGRLLGALLEGRLGIEVVNALPGVVLAMLFVSAPLVVQAAVQGFRTADVRLERIAESLGATPAQAFVRVSLPLARPALVAGAMSAFARAVSEFGSIVVLAYFPRSAPVLIWERFTAYGLDAAVPATGVLLVVSLVVFWLWTLSERQRQRHADD